MPGHTTGWLFITFANNSRIERVRTSLYNAIGAPSVYTLEHAPHITLFRFTISSDALPGFRKAITPISAHLSGTRVSVDGFHVYPDRDNPMVVSLSPSIDVQPVCAETISLLEQYRGSVTYGPDPPHITLFKGGVSGDEETWGNLDDETRARLHSQLENQQPAFSLTISEISVST